MRTVEEPELVARARRGDDDACAQLVHAHREIALRTAFLLAGSAADAEEAMQDGFVKAFAALGRFRDGAPFRPWLLRIVANEALNRRRAAGRRAQLSLRAAQEPPESEPSPEAVALAAERRVELLAALDALREEERAVVGCRFLLDLSEEETATVLGMRRGTVKSRTSRGLARLRALLTEEGADDVRAR